MTFTIKARRHLITAQALTVRFTNGCRQWARPVRLFCGLALLAACGPEPTEPAKTSLAGTWTAKNARLYQLSNFRLEIIQEPQGIVSGRWFARGEAGVAACPSGNACDAFGNLIGRNTVSQVELELLGAGKFEGGLVELDRMRGIFAVQDTYDTITFVRSPGSVNTVNR